MLTRMTDEDWATVLEVFRAVRSRVAAKAGTTGSSSKRCITSAFTTSRGAPAGRVRELEFSVEALLALEQAGVFEAFFDALAAMSQTAHLVQMFDSTVVRATSRPQAPKGGRRVKRWAARAAGSRPRSTSRLIWMDAPSRFTSQRVRPATARNLRSCLILGPTSRPARLWGTKAMMPKPIAQPRASVASAR